MATIKITDELGFDIEVKLADTAALAKYARAVPNAVLHGIDLRTIGGLTLDQPAVTSLKAGLSFSLPVGLGTDSLSTTVEAGLHASFSIDEVAGGNAPVTLEIEATAGGGAQDERGRLTFGVEAGGKLQYANTLEIPAKTTLTDALKEVAGEFLIPATVEDLAAIPRGGTATVDGSHSLELSVTADLLAVTNPLATLTLPAPIPSLELSHGGEVSITPSLKITGAFQIKAQNKDGKIRLGWYRKTSHTIGVQASVSAGVLAEVGQFELFSRILQAISGDPEADAEELKKAGLTPDQIKAVGGAVAAAVQRTLELAVSAEITALRSDQAAFEYEIDAGATTPESRARVADALAGDLTPLHTGLAGVTPVSSVWTKVKETGLSFNVNLLGIYNFASIAKFAVEGVTAFDPATGSLVITDKATAKRIRVSTLNFAADSEKLRDVQAESFLITAAYQCERHLVGAGPQLSCAHSFFKLDPKTDRREMRRLVQTGIALGLLSEAEAALPEGVEDFGRTTVDVNARYDAPLTASLFVENEALYEQCGREAIQLLIREDDEDASRRKPAIDNELWAKMRRKGDAQDILKLVENEPFKEAIFSDYLTIVWWASAMAGAATILNQMRALIARGADERDEEFQELREQLAKHLREVAKNTRAEFGQPWGMVAMSQLSGRKPAADLLIASAKYVRAKSKPQGLAAAAQGIIPAI